MLLPILLGCAAAAHLDEISAEHSDAASYLSHEQIPRVPSGSPVMYFDGTSWSTRALELIEESRSSILIDSFLIGAHERSAEIFEALADAAGRGVSVRIMMDSSSYYRISQDDGTAVYVPVSELRDMGLEVTEYNPIRSWRFYRHLFLLDRDHRKFWIIDGETVAAGGMNIDSDSLTKPEQGGNIDSMTEIYSPASARLLTESFIESWNHYSLDTIDEKQFPPAEADSRRLTGDVWVVDQNKTSGSTVTVMFDTFLGFAREELWMMQGYLIPTPALLARIEHAAERGVQVHVILSANHVVQRLQDATYYSIQDLLDAGARVYIYEAPTGSLLHTKLLVADDRLV